MNSQIIVIVQVLIAGTFILWILSRRGSSPKPTVLNMRADMKTQKPTVLGVKAEVQAKVLNVIFMWNGHGWDAYEVFGLPAGSSISDVRRRFQDLTSQTDDDGQKQFLSAALDAIENKAAG
tara:strand:- start:71923 stop:72285 length:363 start_codon:yes stop_codon:yes gene_type:complete